MTCILGYISDNPGDKTSMFLASDDRIERYLPPAVQLDYPKIFRFNDFLLSFNGEVALYEEVKKKVMSLEGDIDNIQDLQTGINEGFNFDYFRVLPSHSEFSNIIILDINNRILAHHFVGNLGTPAEVFFPFDFDILKRNTLYHFGSVLTFINKGSDQKIRYKTEDVDCIKETLEEQIEFWESFFIESNDRYGGIGKLHSYYLKGRHGYPIEDKIE